MKQPAKPALRRVQGADSWRFASNLVEAFVTRRGGHLAPVTFSTPEGDVQPYAIAPWSTERVPRGTPDLLKTLRGDFFCMPFGGNAEPWRGEQHPLHGETASSIWADPRLEADPDGVEFSVRMRTRVRPGLVIKRIRLRANETNVYCQHELIGFSGPMSLGHHAMLKFPPEEGSGRLIFSPWIHGQVCPVPLESPAQGGNSCLKPTARFTDLRRVPLAAGGLTDLASYPARAGSEDLVMLSQKHTKGLAWTTVAFPAQGYLWFSLKETRTLASTVLWYSNGGRPYAPWNGRHRHVMGLEDVTANFHFGLAASARANALRRRGIPTTVSLRSDRPFIIRYVMGVVPIPRRFDRVRTVQFKCDHLVFNAVSGTRANHALDLGFFGSEAAKVF